MIEKGLGKNGRRQCKSEQKDLGMMISSIFQVRPFHIAGLTKNIHSDPFFSFKSLLFFFFFSKKFFLKECLFFPIVNINISFFIMQ